MIERLRSIKSQREYQSAMSKSNKIAMWSGPRNLSTAMMRSFGARDDCIAMDEPYYAAFLAKTGLKHPMYKEIIEDGETDPQKVRQLCLNSPIGKHQLVYQKHMTHHMLEDFDISWINQVTNVFLIRSPERVLASYAAKHSAVTAFDTGIIQQRKIYDLVKETTNKDPIVIDAFDVRSNPKQMLMKLCEAIGIGFSQQMLSWEKGPKPEDGIWASHWYDAVWNSTAFAPPETTPIAPLPPHLEKINSELMPHFQTMLHHKIQP